MSERLAWLLDLASRSYSLAGPLTQWNCWVKVAEQAADENNEKVFEQAHYMLSVIRGR